jgi:uncharacterized membrane protein
MRGMDDSRTISRPVARRRPLITAGIVLGIGLGGFVDGILLHQVLQWHHMLTSAGFPADSVANLRIDSLADGLFHAFAWVFTVAGVYLLWCAVGRAEVPRSTPTLWGAIAIGWGMFNLVEGIVDHQVLGIHHVNETAPREHWIWWDLGFLGLGLVLVIIGCVQVRAGRADRPAGVTPP